MKIPAARCNAQRVWVWGFRGSGFRGSGKV